MNGNQLNLGITRSMPSQGYFDWQESSQQVQTKIKSLLVIAATGLGKTVMMGGIARSWPQGRIMMISHRFELNQQAIKSFEWICNEEVDLEQASYMADQRANPHRIVVASVPTLNARRKGELRLNRFNPDEFGLLLIDEAHRSTAVSYQRVIDHFRQNPNLVVVGVTATPDRADDVALGSIYEDVVCDYNIEWAVKNGWLVEPCQKVIHVESLDFSDIRTQAGDLHPGDLAKLVEAEENLHAMAEPIVDITGPDEKCIVFCRSVAQSRRLAEMIRDYYHRKFGHYDANIAVSIDGSLSPQDPARQAILREFKEGGIHFLCNVGVATEGFDAPNVSVVAMGRPTKSRSLYTQMLGRGTRPLAGVVDGIDCPLERQAAIARSAKPMLTVIDFHGQSGRHELVHSADVLAGSNDPPEVVEKAYTIAAKGDFDGSTLDALREAREAVAAEKEARRLRLTAKVNYSVNNTKRLFDEQKFVNTRVPNYMRNKPVTPKQKNMLVRLGYTTTQIQQFNPRSASAAIEYAIENPRTKFGWWLKRKKAEEENA